MDSVPETPGQRTRTAVTGRIIAHVRRGWPRLGEPIVRHRGRFCYVSALMPGRREPTPILRLRYQGPADRWAIGIYLASSGQYTESELPASFGPKPARPKKESMTPSSSTRAPKPATYGPQPAPGPKPRKCETRDTWELPIIPFCSLQRMDAEISHAVHNGSRATVGISGCHYTQPPSRKASDLIDADSVRPGVAPFARLDPRRSPRSGCWLISRSWRSPSLQSRGLAPTGFERPGLVDAAQATAASAASCEVCLRGTMRRGHGDRLSRAARTALHRPVSLSSTAHTPGA